MTPIILYPLYCTQWFRIIVQFLTDSPTTALTLCRWMLRVWRRLESTQSSFGGSKEIGYRFLGRRRRFFLLFGFLSLPTAATTATT